MANFLDYCHLGKVLLIFLPNRWFFKFVVGFFLLLLLLLLRVVLVLDIHLSDIRIRTSGR